MKLVPYTGPPAVVGALATLADQASPLEDCAAGASGQGVSVSGGPSGMLAAEAIAENFILRKNL